MIQPFAALLRRRASLRSLAGTVAFALAAWGGPGSARAQAPAPSGPVRILVGFPAGGTIDVVTRQVAEHMQQTLGVPVVVDSLPGAGGQLAAQQLKRAAPDGRTLMVAPDHTAVIVPLTLRSPGFDVQADFAPVGMVADYAGALAVSQASGIRDMADLIARARVQPDLGNVGVSAPGSKPQFLLAALGRQQGLAINAVPYKGSVPMVQDLAGGHLAAGVTALGDFLEFHRAGKLKVIAVTSEARQVVLPQVPTAAEAGYPLRMDFWIGMFAPAATPAPLLDRLNQALNEALASRAVQERMTALVFSPARGPRQMLSERIAAEMRQWEPVVAASGWTKQ